MQIKTRTGFGLVAAALAASALLLSGCTGTSSPTTTGTVSGGASASGPVAESYLTLYKDMTPAPNAKVVDTSKYLSTKQSFTIGFADVGLVNSWHVQALGAAQILADEMGVKLIVVESDGDATKQISDIEDLLARGVDALVIQPNSPQAMAPVIERAYASGIPVILWGATVDTDKVTASVVADDTFFGQEGAKKLVADMGGSGNVVMLRGIAGNSVETARYDGAKAVFDAAGVKVLAEQFGDWALDKGKAITENFIAAYPNIDGIWSSGGAMTLGAVQAYQEAGIPLVPMSGEGLNGFLKAAVAADLKTSAPAFPTWQGPEALKLAVRALQGMPIDDSYLLQAPSIADIKTAVLPDVSDDYWVEPYLTLDQINKIFPPTT